MLTLLGTPRRFCDGITRREALQAGGVSLLAGLFGLPNLLGAAEARRKANRAGKAKSVIVLHLQGGAPTQDMVDLKPDAPSGIRSLFKPIATRTTGIQVCEHLPRLAKWMHKIAVVRSVNHKGGCHNLLPAYTGYAEPVNGAVVRDTYPPSMGAVCEYLKKEGGDFPAAIHMPCYPSWGTAYRYPGPYAGFLGRRYDPLFTECTAYVDNPPDTPYHPKVLRGAPRLPTSTLPEGLTLDRLNQRRTLIDQFDDQLRSGEARGNFDRAQDQALTLLTSRKVKAAFNVSAIDPKLRDRYGNTLFGTSALIARRLVQEGVRFVNVTWESFGVRLKINHDGWDTHQRNFEILKEYLLPYFDFAYAALLEELDERGQLDETLVVVMSEMGRTPKVNANQAGRDHWTFCYSVLLAGAGIRGGTVYGASDAQAAYVKNNPVSPADICATIYQCLGIDPNMPVHDASGKPVPVAQGGRAIREILV